MRDFKFLVAHNDKKRTHPNLTWQYIDWRYKFLYSAYTTTINDQGPKQKSYNQRWIIALDDVTKTEQKIHSGQGRPVYLFYFKVMSCDGEDVAKKRWDQDNKNNEILYEMDLLS